MINPRTVAEPRGDRELIVRRVFDAPRELVFKAWTEEEGLMRWWGPPTWPLKYCKVDLRPGGTWLYCMGGPNGEESWGKGVYKEILPPSRLVYADYFSNAEGAELSPPMVVAIDFIDQGGKTLMDSVTTWESPEDRAKVLEMGMIEGMSESMDRLDGVLTAATARG